MNKKNKQVGLIFEEKIKIQNIQGFLENKQKHLIKIKEIEETIKLLELNDNSINISRMELNNSLNNNGLGSRKDIIEENLKKNKIKSLKKEINILEEKIKFIDLEIISTQKIEEEKKRKFDMKNFLENFEKDKKEVEEKELIWKRDHMIRIKKFELEQERMKEKLREKLENEDLENNQKKQDKYLEQLEKLKAKTEAMRESIELLKERKQESKAHQINSKNLTYKINEEKLKKKENEEKDQYKQKMIEELSKIHQFKKRLALEEIEKNKKLHDDKFKARKYEKQKEDLLKKEELIKQNSQMPRGETKMYKKVSTEDKKIRIKKTQEKMDKVYTAMKVKQFSKIVLTSIIPKIDEEKRNELQELISKSQYIRPSKLGKSSTHSERVILKKPDPESRKKYKWDLKLDPIDEIIEPKYKKRNKRVFSQIENNYSDLENDNDNEYENHNNNNDNLLGKFDLERLKSASPKRIPMIKAPDYLTSIRKQKEEKEKEKYSEIEVNDNDKENENINKENIRILSKIFISFY
jgi:hypothetical protein